MTNEELDALSEIEEQRDNLKRLLENILRDDADGQDYKDAWKYLERLKGKTNEQ